MESIDKRNIEVISDLLKANTRVMSVKDVNIAHGMKIVAKSIEKTIMDAISDDTSREWLGVAVIVAYNNLVATGTVISTPSKDDVLYDPTGIVENITVRGVVKRKNGRNYTTVTSIQTLVRELLLSRAISYAFGSENAAADDDATRNAKTAIVLKSIDDERVAYLSDPNLKVIVVIPVNDSGQSFNEINSAIRLVREVDEFKISTDELSDLYASVFKESASDPYEHEEDEKPNSRGVGSQLSISKIVASAASVNTSKVLSRKEKNTINVAKLSIPINNVTFITIQSDDGMTVQGGIPVIDTSIGHKSSIQEEILSNKVFNIIHEAADPGKRKLIDDTIFSDINNNSMITKIGPEFSLDRIGGYDEIKSFIRERGELLRKYGDKLKEHSIELKGIFMFGIPGAGKTTMAKCVGNELGIPAYQINIESGLTKLFGESERNLIRTLNLLEQRGRAAVVIDEIDKLFAGVATGTTGNDVPIRLFGILLQYMAKDNGLVFCVTANALNMKEEFMRKGRFDRIFFVDVPSKEERKKIARIYIEKNKIGNVLNNEDIEYIAESTKGFTGADIESLIKEVTIKIILSGSKKLTKSKKRDILDSVMGISKSMISEKKMEEIRNMAAAVANNKVAFDID